ncbi:hypothetical protein ANCDUO_08538, partial [Ancylostoma duodenale]
MWTLTIGPDRRPTAICRFAAEKKFVESPRKAAGYWGTVGKCDIPYWTLKNMLEHINATHEIDYIMLSGDFINHFDWSYTVDEHVATLRNLSSL